MNLGLFNLVGAVVLAFVVIMGLALFVSRGNSTPRSQELSSETFVDQLITQAAEANYSYEWHLWCFDEPQEHSDRIVMLGEQTVRAHFYTYRPEGMMVVFVRTDDPDSEWAWNCYSAESGPDVITVNPVDERLFMERMAARAWSMRTRRQNQRLRGD